MAATQYPPYWIYRMQVADLTTPPSATLRTDATIADVLRILTRIDDHVAVCRSDGSLAGVVDTLAVAHWLAHGQPITGTLPPLSLPASRMIASDVSAFAALSHMIAHDQAALSVVDHAGRFLGLIKREQILAKAVGFVWDVARAGATGDTGGCVATANAMRRCQTDIATSMLDDGLPSESILATITEINKEVHRGVLTDVIAAFEADGWGPPPAPFSLLGLGSSGRHESFLDPDQDTAFVIAEPDAGLRQAVETYFIELSERLSDGLVATGFPYCKGNMMVTSPVWRKTQSEWRAQIRSWVREKDPVLLMNCDTLLDMAHVAGTEQLALDLHRDLLDTVRREPGFLRALYSIEENHNVGLDWLGRLAREQDDLGSIAEVDLKLRGLLPLIEGARLLSVSAGIMDTSTVARLRKLGACGVISEETMDGLVESYRLIAARLLRHQIELRASPTSSSVRVAHASMSPTQRVGLRAALRRIARLRSLMPSLLESAANGVVRA